MKRLAFRCPLEAERFRLNEQIVNTRETGRSPKKKKKRFRHLQMLLELMGLAMNHATAAG